MNVIKFDYKKKNSEDVENRELMVLFENETHKMGIDISKLSESEYDELKKIQKDYEEKLKPFTRKAYRNFIKENISNEEKLKV